MAENGKYFIADHSRGRLGGIYGYYHTTKGRRQYYRQDVVEDQFEALLNSLEPTEATQNAFYDVFKEKYQAQIAELRQVQDEADKEIATLHEAQKQGFDGMLSGEIDSTQFEDYKDDIETNAIVTESTKNEAKMDLAVVETLRNFSDHFIHNLGHYWRQAEYPLKVRIQNIIFPQGLLYKKDIFTIPEITCLYRVKSQTLNENSLVRAVGFEPTTRGLKGRCSTTELRPQNYNIIHNSS